MFIKPPLKFFENSNIPLSLLYGVGVGLSILLGFSVQSFAQVSIPQSAETGRLQDNIFIPKQDYPDIKPNPKAEARNDAPEIADAEKITFKIEKIQFEGLSKFLPDELENIYRPKLGQVISLKELEQIADRIQKFYADEGYVLTRVIIPEQDVNKGIVTLKIIEGYFSEIIIDGPLSAEPIVQAAAHEIKAMKPINMKKLERILLLLNDRPGLNVAGIVDKPKQDDAEGALLLILKKENDKRLSGSIGFSNDYSEFTGPWQMQAGLNITHPYWNYSSTNLNLATDPRFDEIVSANFAHTIPLRGISGLNFILSGSLGKTEPGESLKPLKVNGDSETLEAKISYPIIRQREEALYLETSFDINNSITKLDKDEFINDRVRSIRLGSFYRFYDKYHGENDASVKLSQGIGLLGASSKGDDKLSRDFGDPNYTKIEASHTRTHALPKNMAVQTKISGQYSNDALLASEEFGFGGSEFGRGYDPSELSGDKGIAASIELQKTIPFSQQKIITQSYAFMDAGKVWNIDSGDTQHESAVSAGFGVRAQVNDDIGLNFRISKPLTRNMDNPPPYTDDDGLRINFSIRKSF